jgi:hypothetical protein
MSTHLNAGPSTHVHKCTHDPIQGRSKFIIDHCAAQKTQGACEDPTITDTRMPLF